MSSSIVAVLVVIGALGIVALVTSGTAAASGSCSVTVHHENLANDAVQTAINTYPGGTICLGSGTFPEQLTISNSGTTLKGAGASNTIIEPNAALSFNTYDYDSPYGATSTPAAAIILVEGSSGDPTTGVSGVTVENLQVNGAAGASTFSACGDNYFGVDFQASSGTLTDAKVVNVALPTADFGCQDGLAIYAYNGYFNYEGTNHAPNSVTISQTTVSSYDKNGITCDDPQESCTVRADIVTGIGSTNLIAQNGVQVAFGAWASVKSSVVSANRIYTGAGGCTGSDQSNYANCTSNEGAGILLYDADSGTSVSHNYVPDNEFGIDYFADGSLGNGYQGPATISISHNVVNSSTAYGIVAEGAPGSGDSVTISSNTVNDDQSLDSSTWGAPGILVDTGNFTVTDNHIDGSSTASGSTNGASQTVCSPSGTFYVCSTTSSIATAAIQGVSGSSANLTWLDIGGNSYSGDSYRLATLGVNGGSVNVQEVS